MSDLITKTETGFVKNYPAVVIHLVSGAVAAGAGWLLPWLVLHGVITSTQASSVSQAVVPAVTSAVSGLAIAALGFLVTHYVSPAAAFADRVQAEVEARWRALQLTNSLAPVLPVVEDAAKQSPLVERLEQDAKQEAEKVEAEVKDHAPGFLTGTAVSRPSPHPQPTAPVDDASSTGGNLEPASADQPADPQPEAAETPASGSDSTVGDAQAADTQPDDSVDVTAALAAADEVYPTTAPMPASTGDPATAAPAPQA